MRKFTFLFAVILAAIFSVPLNAGINPATAWWNNEDFESYDVLQDMNAAAEWSSSKSYFYIIQNVGANASTASGKVFGISYNSNENFGQVTGSQSDASKSFENSLTGLVYVKGSVHSCTQGTMYQLKNSEGNLVFGFGGKNPGNASGAAFCLQNIPENTKDSWISAGTGVRDSWGDFEFLLDLENKKALKVIVKYNDVVREFNDINLPAGDDLKSLNIYFGGTWPAAGFDNMTIAEVVADDIKNLTGDSEIQTLSVGNTTGSYSLTSFATMMETELEVAPLGAIQWSISSFGGLTPEDQALVSVAADAADSRSATLTAGAISADATITIQATYNGQTRNINVALKKPSLDGIKANLMTEINNAMSLMAAVTDNNPYIAGIKQTLTGVQNSSQTIYDSSADMEEIAQAITDMQNAQSAFSGAMVDYDAYTAYIQNVQQASDAETRTESFITASKATLDAAITTANDARTTIATTEDIASAQATLNSALDKFNTDIQAFETFAAAITSAQTSYNTYNLRRGTQFLAYSEEALNNLSTAISDASTALSIVTTAEALAGAETDLSEALAGFNVSGRVSPDEARFYNIYTYGVHNGDGNNDKKVLYADAAGVPKLAVVGDEAIVNANWVVSLVSNNKYTIYNYDLGKYLGGSAASLQDESYEFTIRDNKSRDGIYERDGFFQHSILNSSNSALEVRDAGALGFSANIYERFRQLFQFEPDGLIPGVGIDIENSDEKKDELSTTYFDMTGRQVSADTKGFVIKKIVYVDGSVSSKKEFVK